MSTRAIPEDLAGLQQVMHGWIQDGDLLISGPEREKEWATSMFFGWQIDGEHVGQDGSGVIRPPAGNSVFRPIEGVAVYRKMPVPSHRDQPVPTVSGPSITGSAVITGPMEIRSGPDPRPSFIPQGDAERKGAPLFRGLFGYFPAALFAVARHSMDSDRKHNPGATDGPHWARGKSADHADCILRHLVDAGGGEIDEPDTEYHLVADAWRSLALLQEFLERKGARPGVRAVFSPDPNPHQ